MFLHPTLTALSSHHDGELTDGAAARLDDHLRECESCLVEYQRISQAANSVRHLPGHRAPQNLAARVREQIDAEDRGMVPVLRSLIMRAPSQAGWLSSYGMGTLATLVLVGMIVFLDQRYGEQAARQLTTALIETSLPEPVLLHEPMLSPRVRHASVNGLPFAEVSQGQEGTLLTLASIDQFGMVRGLEVVYRSGDEEMLARALEAVRASGFEPARLGDHAISVNFLYLFTTTEVRSNGRLSGMPDSARLSARVRTPRQAFLPRA